MSSPKDKEPPKDALKLEIPMFRCAVRSSADPTKLEILELQAPTREELIVRLQAKNYLIINVHEVDSNKPKSLLEQLAFASMKKGGTGKSLFGEKKLTAKVSTRELVSFVIQLAALLKSGVPLLQSLRIVHRGVKSPSFKEVLNQMIEDIKQGFSLHYAIGRQGKVFPSILPNLVEVGEVSGNLVDVLEEIARYQEASARMAGKVISAFFYPAILILLAFGAVIFLLIEIIPKFEVVFVNMKMKLPFITQVVMALSRLIRFYGPFVVGGIIAVIVGIGFLVKTPKGKLVVDTTAMKLPVFGTLFMEVAIVRFTRGFSTMLQSGIPILNCIKIAGKLTENALMIKVLDEIHDSIQAGHGLGLQLEKTRMFPPFMTSLISVGEECGELVRFLKLIADYYEERVDTFLGRLGSVLEPILLVVVGGVIGVIVISVFLPLMEMSTMGGR